MLSNSSIKINQKYYINYFREDFSDSDTFIDSGFLTIQNWIDNTIFQIESNDENVEITPSLASLKTPAYEKDNIAIYLQGQTNVFLVLPLILPYLRMIYRLVYEKVLKFYK